MLYNLLISFLFLFVCSAAAGGLSQVFRARHAQIVKSLVTAAVSFSFMGLDNIARADQIECAVTLQEGSIAPSEATAALYLTARLDVGVWQSAVRNMKPAPVLSSRLASPLSFPLKVVLDSDRDSTPEGVALKNDWTSGRLPLAVSARLDSDGNAATRDPSDLVGRGTAEKIDGKWSITSIVLQDRGATGRFLTNKSK